MGVQDRLITIPERSTWRSEPIKLVAVSAPHRLIPSTTELRIMSVEGDRFVFVTGSEHGPVFHTTEEGREAPPYMAWSNSLTEHVMPFFKAIHDWYEEQVGGKDGE